MNGISLSIMEIPLGYSSDFMKNTWVFNHQHLGYGSFLGGNPSYHPFYFRIFHYKPTSSWDIPIYGNPHMNRTIKHGDTTGSMMFFFFTYVINYESDRWGFAEIGVAPIISSSTWDFPMSINHPAIKGWTELGMPETIEIQGFPARHRGYPNSSLDVYFMGISH